MTTLVIFSYNFRLSDATLALQVPLNDWIFVGGWMDSSIDAGAQLILASIYDESACGCGIHPRER